MMSVTVLQELQTELRRVSIAGSALAKDDFRLKKLAEPLRVSATKAPVFGKVADQIEALTTATSDASPVALMELATLTQSILATQGQTEVDGPGFELLEPIETGLRSRAVPAKVLRPIIDALTTSGSGRLEVIRSAIVGGHFQDLRLVGPAINALGDPYPEIVELLMERVLPMYGAVIAPAIEGQLNIEGGMADARRLLVLGTILGTDGRAIYENALEHGSKEVRAAAVQCLAPYETAWSLIVEAASDRAAAVRTEALRALGSSTHDDAVAVLIKAVKGKDLERALVAVRDHTDARIHEAVAAEAHKSLTQVLEQGKGVKPATVWHATLLAECLNGHDHDDTRAVLDEAAQHLASLKPHEDLQERLCDTMYGRGSERARDALHEAAMNHDAPFLYGLAIDFDRMTASDFFDAHASALASTKQRYARRRRDAVESLILTRAYRLIDTDVIDEGRRWSLAMALPSVWNIRFQHGPDWLEPLVGIDDRWLDAAIDANRPELVAALIRPGHDRAVKYLESEEWHDDRKAVPRGAAGAVSLLGLARADHPRFEQALLDLLPTTNTNYWQAYWIGTLADRLSPEGRETLLKQLSTLHEYIADIIREGMDPHEQQHTP